MSKLNIMIAYSLASAIFDMKGIKCDPIFTCFPAIRRWECTFNTEFNHSHLKETFDFSSRFPWDYERFFQIISVVRNEIKQYYDAYFNEVWC